MPCRLSAPGLTYHLLFGFWLRFLSPFSKSGFFVHSSPFIPFAATLLVCRRFGGFVSVECSRLSSSAFPCLLHCFLQGSKRAR